MSKDPDSLKVKLIVLCMAVVVGLFSLPMQQRNSLQEKYDDLQERYDDLQEKYDDLMI